MPSPHSNFPSDPLRVGPVTGAWIVLEYNVPIVYGIMYHSNAPLSSQFLLVLSQKVTVQTAGATHLRCAGSFWR